MSTPRVFTIPASAPFLPTLVNALLDGKLVPGFEPRNNPLALASATIFLPTRRAARALSHAILDALGTDAALLPKIVPLGDVDEDEFAFEDAASEGRLLPPIEPAQRRLALAKLVLKYAKVSERIATTPSAAIALADQLARLFDDFTIAKLKPENLTGIVPPELDKHWEVSLEFLKFARKAWHDHLLEQKLLDGAARRDELLRREAYRLKGNIEGPFIAAGSTGTIPAVAELLAAIARRSDGAVVLPGLDQKLDDESYALIEGGKIGEVEIESSSGHPQFGLKRLLERIGIARADVKRIEARESTARERFLSHAFRPAATTERWRTGKDTPREVEIIETFKRVTVIEAADPRAEALAIALTLRETVELPGKRAALVTPDRTLARRVAAELARWQIEVEDSAGVSLGDTEAGLLARLVAAAAAERLAPVPLIALLRHALADPGATSDAIDLLEIAVLRGPRPASGAGLVRAVEDARGRDFHPRDPRSGLRAEDWDSALKLAQKIVGKLQPLLDLAEARSHSIEKLVAAHRAVLTAIGLDLARTSREDARKLDEAFASLAQAAAAPELSLADYSEALPALLSDQKFRPPVDPASRICILGALEARLLDFDRMVIGGVNEGVWPPEAQNDSWLNRPMRKRLGLDLPERRVGLSAHDFVQAACAGEIIFTRARKQNGVETVASRFLQRIKAIAPEDAWSAALERGEHYLALARVLETPAQRGRIKRPEPRPPVALRPARLSVTEIEALIRDPYTIYARHVLKLLALEPLDAAPDAAARGTLLHDAIGDFTGKFPEELPSDAFDRLLAFGKQAFAKYEDFPEVVAVWWPRFERVARWFISQEPERRKNVAHILAETNGRITFAVSGRDFTLSARADRIDLRKDGAVVILDYKTGTPPSAKEAIVGLAPQLPLEAAIVRGGGFKEIPANNHVADIQIMRLSGGEPPGETSSFHPDQVGGPTKKLFDELKLADLDALADFSLAKLKARLTQFADAKTPYLPVPRPKWKLRFGEYDHLARIKEWSESGGGEDT